MIALTKKGSFDVTDEFLNEAADWRHRSLKFDDPTKEQLSALRKQHGSYAAARYVWLWEYAKVTTPSTPEPMLLKARFSRLYKTYLLLWNITTNESCCERMFATVRRILKPDRSRMSHATPEHWLCARDLAQLRKWGFSLPLEDEQQDAIDLRCATEEVVEEPAESIEEPSPVTDASSAEDLEILALCKSRESTELGIEGGIGAFPLFLMRTLFLQEKTDVRKKGVVKTQEDLNQILEGGQYCVFFHSKKNGVTRRYSTVVDVLEFVDPKDTSKVHAVWHTGDPDTWERTIWPHEPDYDRIPTEVMLRLCDGRDQGKQLAERLKSLQEKYPPKDGLSRDHLEGGKESKRRRV